MSGNDDIKAIFAIADKLLVYSLTLFISDFLPSMVYTYSQIGKIFFQTLVNFPCCIYMGAIYQAALAYPIQPIPSLAQTCLPLIGQERYNCIKFCHPNILLRERVPFPTG